ncbi:pyridoxal-phosphate dependent enzyme [Nonomuraea ferruginea]
MQSFVRAYGAAVFSVPVERRWPLMTEIVDRLGYHPVSNQTVTHTGHPYGPEGYKTIEYELFVQLGRAPAAVFAPTGYAELLYGVWKGFAELRRLGVAGTAPRMFSCEPAAGGPHARAVATGAPAAIVEVGPTDAYGIACPMPAVTGACARSPTAAAARSWSPTRNCARPSATSGGKGSGRSCPARPDWRATGSWVPRSTGRWCAWARPAGSRTSAWGRRRSPRRRPSARWWRTFPRVREPGSAGFPTPQAWWRISRVSAG